MNIKINEVCRTAKNTLEERDSWPSAVPQIRADSYTICIYMTHQLGVRTLRSTRIKVYLQLIRIKKAQRTLLYDR
jgi:hypothetical protein